MADVPQTDVSRPSALPTARLPQPPNQSSFAAAYGGIDPSINSGEYLTTVEEEWNKKIDVDIETLVDGMVDIVGLASVGVVIRG